MSYTETTNIKLKKPATGTPGADWKTYMDENFETLDTEIANRHKKNEDILPDADIVRSLGSAIKWFLNGFFSQLTLGGVIRTSWPTAVAGSNGNVFYSGSITLNGQNGVTVTHNKGDTSYIVKLMPRDVVPHGSVGDMSVVRAANTVSVYNSGFAGGIAEIEISNIA